MYKLYNNKQFYFPNASFINSIDNVHIFEMKNYRIGMHKQEFFEINIITRGKGKHYIEENEMDANVGDVFIIPPEVAHGYTGGEGFDVCHITINNSFMQKNLADLQNIEGFSVLFNVEPLIRARTNKHLHLKLNDEQFKEVYEILEKNIGRGRFTTSSIAFKNIGTFFLLVTILCEIYSESLGANSEKSSSSDAAFMKAIALIHERYAEKLTLDMLANEARLSKSSFMRRFVYICKMPPAEYIIKKRIEVAETILKNTNASLFEIAEQVGFYDTAHLSRTFKKIKGVTPSEFRKNLALNNEAAVSTDEH